MKIKDLFINNTYNNTTIELENHFSIYIELLDEFGGNLQFEEKFKYNEEQNYKLCVELFCDNEFICDLNHLFLDLDCGIEYTKNSVLKGLKMGLIQV